MKKLDISNWTIKQDLSNLEYMNESETVFAQANGYFGIRGTIEEGYSNEIEGTFINGFYDTEDIIYGESAYGYAKERQTQLLVPNTKNIKLFIDDEELNIEYSKLENHFRELNLKNGIITRNLTWKTNKNKILEISFERFVSMDYENLMIINLSIKPLNFSGKIKIISGIKEDKVKSLDENDPRVSGQLKYSLKNYDFFKKDDCIVTKSKTYNSNLQLITSVINKSDNIKVKNIKVEGKNIFEEFCIDLKQNIESTVTKYCFYYFEKKSKIEVEEKLDLFKELTSKDFRYYKSLQEKYYEEFWNISDIILEGNKEIQAAIRFNIFHLIQSVGKNGKTNIAAKGLTGDGYEGHYFWDTETYVIPHFIYTNPDIAKKLLSYRYSILHKAKKRAEELSFKGALFPWRTINGEESSAYYPAGTAQIHINADIMYSLKKYYEVTDDLDFMINKGLEMLVETSRFYADYSDYIDGRGYCINGVTGPDEYSALVNNNTYTNMMIRYQIKFLMDFIGNLKIENIQLYNEIMKKFKITNEELILFNDIYEKIYIHYDKEKNLIGQDDSFLNQKMWDFENTPKEKYPLLLNYHPMIIYKHQVIKQADLVLSMMLIPEYFTDEEKKANFDYYENVTTHDSSLSECIHGIIANELGYEEMSVNFFENTVKTDLYDLHNNVKNGVHIASMAGSWQCIVFGFLGMREIDGVLNFKPNLPRKYKKIELKLRFKGRIIGIILTEDQLIYSLIEGESIEIVSNGEKIILI
ncbi:glycoside hydrolase family 65 protein [Romboutsia lituseburensis]|uniref:Alpha,alpha-trehalose phosphorylase n=1 Tax=Romboutsia lituseburensis DSM 797 TaxID=1121325 RepID=A0A1G9I078_9FIRM|nr:glycosyl hydrolase family 65 protein [Romboutsia lituseburensis]CEH34106.1 Alpha,alpha-trehalose phosphorylase [Romboutsia lituseburensis]SDL18456.1 alpha,alpha-trehalose phosphorylase [Romboutsia lituseburensis DSM 797]